MIPPSVYLGLIYTKYTELLIGSNIYRSEDTMQERGVDQRRYAVVVTFYLVL